MFYSCPQGWAFVLSPRLVLVTTSALNVHVQRVGMLDFSPEGRGLPSGLQHLWTPDLWVVS